MRISDWSSDVCSSDLLSRRLQRRCPLGTFEAIYILGPHSGAHILEPTFWSTHSGAHILEPTFWRSICRIQLASRAFFLSCCWVACSWPSPAWLSRCRLPLWLWWSQLVATQRLHTHT